MGVLETLGWALSVFTILALGKRAVDKLIGTEEMIKYLSSINLEKYRVIIGLGEITSIILFFEPISSLFGAILIGLSMSAATITHLSMGEKEKAYMPIIVGITVFLGYFLRVY